MCTDSCEGSGHSALGDTLNKALLISRIGITLYYFRIVSICCSLLILSYFLVLASWTSSVSTTNVELDREVPHWWVMSMVLEVGKILPRSCKIMVRLFSPCNIVVVCICYGLICSLVAVHDHGTHAVAELVMCESQASHELLNHQKMVHEQFWSCVCLLRMSIHQA